LSGEKTLKKLILVLLISAFPFTFTESAFAHAEIAKTNPIKNAILAEPPKSVWIEFGESLLTLDTKVVNTLTVTNSKGKRVDKSPTIISGARATTKILGALKKGKYLVTYRVVSEDGHPVKASYYFSVK
jgi:methionine-rich copper-binding protein CopC